MDRAVALQYLGGFDEGCFIPSDQYDLVGAGTSESHGCGATDSTALGEGGQKIIPIQKLIYAMDRQSDRSRILHQ